MASRPLVRRVRPWLVTAAAALAVATLGVGLLHMPWARPLLARLGGCPASRATPQQVETAQRRAWRTLRGTGSAPDRPALGFALERTTLLDVKAWAQARGLACEVVRGGSLLRCEGVPASALRVGAAGVYDDVAFGFRVRDQRLVNVTALRTGLAAEDAAAQLRDVAACLERALGAPAQKAAGAAAFVVYRYADYLADVTAMQLPSRGHAVREHYMSALD
jgi:hypothetical protein